MQEVGDVIACMGQVSVWSSECDETSMHDEGDILAWHGPSLWDADPKQYVSICCCCFGNIFCIESRNLPWNSLYPDCAMEYLITTPVGFCSSANRHLYKKYLMFNIVNFHGSNRRCFSRL